MIEVLTTFIVEFGGLLLDGMDLIGEAVINLCNIFRKDDAE